MTRSVHVALAGHPANPARFHHRIEATLTHTAQDGLVIIYVVHGLNIDLRIPTPHAPAPADALWRTSCCELFLASANPSGYREFNFSPAGQWWAGDFLDYRAPAPLPPAIPTAPAIAVERDEDRLRLDVALDRTALPKGDTLRLALSVVLEANDSQFGFWALAHPSGKPDFHHHAGFALSLGAMGFRPARWP